MLVLQGERCCIMFPLRKVERTFHLNFLYAYWSQLLNFEGVVALK